MSSVAISPADYGTDKFWSLDLTHRLAAYIKFLRSQELFHAVYDSKMSLIPFPVHVFGKKASAVLF